MANPFIIGSKLTRNEVIQCIWRLCWFHRYADIAKDTGRSPQALRPMLAQIERRMYFESSNWALFHMLILSKYNLNREFRPYENRIESIIDAVHRIPRAPSSEMRIHSETVEFESELACLYDCPQHLPPLKFVERYGPAKPIQNFKPGQHEEECRNRLKRKKHCSKCKSKLIHLWTGKHSYFFRYAMEYAAHYGKPRPQFTDLFIARMAHVLVWRAFDLNMQTWYYQRQLLLRKEQKQMGLEEGKAYFQSELIAARKRIAKVVNVAKGELMKEAVNDLQRNPIRIDRRGAHADP